jgi:flavorubredoxin
MIVREIRPGVRWVGAVDWDRRLFDSLIPLPDGTSYNAYLVEGSEKTALLDTVDPSMTATLLANLEGVDRIDYLVAHHAEQDHSGSIPAVLERYPGAKVLCSPKCKGMLVDHLLVAEDRIIAVADGETLSLGDRTLRFLHTPWVHWPETMVTLLEGDGVLFSCDFFGSHLAQSGLFMAEEWRVYEAAKRYYAEIMMPFRAAIRKNIAAVAAHPVEVIAPSHGPCHERPAFIMDAYRDWTSDTPRNEAVIPFVSMHGSTAAMVDRLGSSLAGHGVTVHRFNLAGADIGLLAMALVDAATVIIGTPAVHVGPHPLAAQAAFLANALRPKARFASVIGSFGWGHKIVEGIAGAIGNLKVEILEPVVRRGYPRPADFEALDRMAAAVAEKHRGLGA